MIKFSRGTGFKKYKAKVYLRGKLVKTTQFGDKRYAQFRDKTPLKLYSKKNHLDKKRKARYYARHKKNYPRYSADWFSKKYLW
tara:strand:- start:758 stop:1006 length:249 start_codon:yes stop_codon:yes gene_type:complete